MAEVQQEILNESMRTNEIFQKMENLFESINSSLLFQSSMLESLYNIQNDAYVMEKERIADEKRARLLSDEPTPETRTEILTEPTSEKPKPEKKESLLGSLFGDIFKGGGKLAVRAIGAGAAAFVITALIDGLKEGFGFGGEGEPVEGEPVEGEPSVLKDIVLKTLPVGLGFFFRGIKGALIGGATSALLDLQEELTGIKLPEEVNTAIAALVGVGGGGKLGGLMRWVLRLAVMTPIGRIVSAAAGAILATKLLVEEAKEVLETEIKEIEDNIEKAKNPKLSLEDRKKALDSATPQLNRIIQKTAADPDTEFGRIARDLQKDLIEAQAGIRKKEGDIKGDAEDRLRAAFKEAKTPDDKINVLDDYIKRYPEYTGNSKGDREDYFRDILKVPFTELYAGRIKNKLNEILGQEEDFDIQPDTITSNPRKDVNPNKFLQQSLDLTKDLLSEDKKFIEFGFLPRSESGPRTVKQLYENWGETLKLKKSAEKLSAVSDGSSTNFNVAKGGDSVNLTPVNNTTNNSYTTIVTSQSTALGNAVPIAFSA